MRARLIFPIVILCAVFYYLNATRGPDDRGGAFVGKVGASARSPLDLTVANAAPSLTREEQNNVDVYRRVLPSVVNVTSSQLSFNFFYGVVPQQGQGSGFILTKDGRILTNYHVIANAQKVEVTLSGGKRTCPADVILQDPNHDIALLQIHAMGLTPVVLSESHDLQVGQEVYAIGNPFGLNGTMTKGIISSIRSVHEPGGTPIEHAIQTDAAINPGNSGGPLLNSRGEVIGMNTLIASNGAEQNTGIGFAIPIDSIKAILSDFSKYGRVRRPSLGIAGFGIDPDLAQQMGLAAGNGVLIQKVIPGGAAELAGLRGGDQKAYLGNVPIYLGGDLIVAIGSQPVTSTEDISDIMDEHRTGDRVTVTFYRGKVKMTVSVVLGEAGQVNT